jgi:hypothetical protein
MLLATWALVACGIWGLAVDLALAMQALAKASVETKHAMLTHGVSVGPRLAVGFSVGGMLTALVAGLAWLTWARPRDSQSAWRQLAALALVLVLPLFATPLSVAPAAALWRANLEVLGYPQSDDLQVPMAANVTEPSDRWVEITVSRRDVTLNGEWVFDLKRVADESGKGWVISLPGDNRPSDWPRLQRRLLQVPRQDAVIQLQVDRRIPWRVLGPVLEEVTRAGFQQVELLAMDADRLGVVVLHTPLQPEPRPGDTLEALLAR